jgi:hypothetical protein
MLFVAFQRFETDLTGLISELNVVCDVKNSYNPLPTSATMPPSRLTKPPFAIVPSVPAQSSQLESLIVGEYPLLFEEFCMK